MHSLIKNPSAWIPIALSLAVLVAMGIAITFSGPPVHESDEGVGAHLFQIWLILEALMIAFFAITWVPQKPKEALIILAIQVLVVLAGCFPVFYFKL